MAAFVRELKEKGYSLQQQKKEPANYGFIRNSRLNEQSYRKPKKFWGIPCSCPVNPGGPLSKKSCDLPLHTGSNIRL
jgi:hypothetical protein